MAPSGIPPPQQHNVFDDDDDEGWQEMPVVREDEFTSGLDEEDRKKFHYTPSARSASAANATGNLIDVDDYGVEWRSKLDQNESEYTRLRVNEEDEVDEVHLRTRYLFDEDKAMTPLSQMQATKNLLTEAQRIAYVGVCALTSREMSQALKAVQNKDMKAAAQNMELWAMKIMGRLYYHMELETQEQKMIESLAVHGVQAEDLAPALMTTHTVANPEYDPAEARRQADLREEQPPAYHEDPDEEEQVTLPPFPTTPSLPHTPSLDTTLKHSPNADKSFQTTAKVLEETSQAAMPGVTTSLSSADENVTLDIRWTVLCDLFLILIADSVYDARSRVLLENVALKLGLGWLDVVKFESRVTEALEIQEGVEKMEAQDLIDGRQKAARKRRYMMMGLATLGGGLVIGLSAGLLAPVIGAGLGAAFTTIGISGTTGFLAGAGGAAVITTGGVLTGSGIAVKGMAKRTKQVRVFDILPLHNNKRVSCILTVPGFMNGAQDDVRLPFSVLDPIVGDVFSVLWEPEMIRETGSALKILTTEVLTQLGQTVLQATVMTALMSALQWPIILTKLGYLIDNPWNNALDRAKAAGSVLADVLIQRHLGVRPITLIGFSLGARVIFYALLELARHKAYGIVQDVFLLGATLTASTRTWCDARSIVSGRFVNAFARNDWVLNYLFRATSGGVGAVAGLRPIQNVPGLENVDVTDKISGHMSYRTFMPLILDQLGFPVFADYFDEPEEPDFKEDRIVVREEDELPQKKGWFTRKKKSSGSSTPKVSRPPSVSSSRSPTKGSASSNPSVPDEDLPPRTEKGKAGPSSPGPSTAPSESERSTPDIPLHAGFDFNAIKDVLGNAELNPQELQVPDHNKFSAPPIPPPTQRSESAPPPFPAPDSPDKTPVLRASFDLPSEAGSNSERDLPSAFSRSMSLHSESYGEDNVTSFGQQPSSALQNSNSPSTGYRSHSTPQPSPTPPTLSFGGSDGPVWSSGRDAATQQELFGTRSAYGRSTDSLSFGNNAGSITGTSGSYGSYVPPPPHNPFTAFSSSPNVDAAGLSFGGADGSITFSPAAERDDPWDRRTINDRKAMSFNANPWGS